MKANGGARQWTEYFVARDLDNEYVHVDERQWSDSFCAKGFLVS